MEFDIRTILFLLFLVSGLLALMLLIYWKTQKTYDGFSLWTWSVILISFGYLLVMLRGIIPALFSIILANILVMLSIFMRVDGISRFIRAKRLPLPVYGILLPLFFLFLYFTYIDDSIAVRAALTSGVFIPCLIIVGIIIAKTADKKNRYINYSFAGALFLTAIIHILRSLEWVFAAQPSTIFSTDEFNSIFFIISLLMEILMTGFFLMLNMVRTQDDLATSEERYRTLSDNLPDYVVVHDGKTIQYANPATIRFLGIPKNKITGVSIAPFIAPEDQGTSETVIKKIQTDAVPAPAREIIIQSSDGTRRTCIITSVPFQFRGSSSILSVLTDITEQKQVEDALRMANKKLNLLSSVTRHDIRNQLMALLTYLELSQDSVDKPAQIAEFILKEKKIASTIEHQINFTYNYEDLGIHAPTWQNVNAILQKTVTALLMRDVRVEIDCTDLDVYADPLFEKVFYNLMDNALRYGGDQMKTITISSSETDRGLILVFEDDGEGIPDDDKAHLFKKGFGRNTGLGLFLSHDILSITGITIAETGKYGKGARFEMMVPKGEYRFYGPGKE